MEQVFGAQDALVFSFYAGVSLLGFLLAGEFLRGVISFFK